MSTTHLPVRPAVRSSSPGPLHAAARTTTLLLLFIVPSLLVVLFVRLGAGGRTTFYDFAGDLYGAGHAVLSGGNPYRPAFLAHLASLQSAGVAPTQVFAVPVYPAPVLVAASPLSLLGLQTAGIVFTLGSIVAMLAGLWLLGVGDWRCYGAAFLSWPLLHSLRLGQVNELLVLGLAVLWRWRSRLWAPAAATAFLLVVKLFLWPVAAWLLITRRVRTFGLSLAVTVVVSVLAWLVVGIGTLGAYPGMLANLSSIEGRAGISVISVGSAFGVPALVSQVIGGGLAGAMLFGAWRIWRGDGQDAERRSFGLAMMAALIASPIGGRTT